MGKWSAYQGQEGRYALYLGRDADIAKLGQYLYQDYYRNALTNERVAIGDCELYDTFEEAVNASGKPLTNEDIEVQFRNTSYQQYERSYDEWNGRDSDELCGFNTHTEVVSVPYLNLVACYGGKFKDISVKMSDYGLTDRYEFNSRHEPFYIGEDDNLYRLNKYNRLNPMRVDDSKQKDYDIIINIVYDAFGL